MITIEGDKAALYQWDLNQRLVLTSVDAITAGIEVHYSSIYDDMDECCLIAPTYSENGNFYADIPNKMLQQHGIISAYLYVQKENKAWTEHKIEILVLPRTRPSNYVYTETEIMDYKEIAKEATKRLDETEGFAIAAEEAAKQAENAANVAVEFANKLVNPEIDVEEYEDGHHVTVNDVNGEKSFYIANGKQGPQGVQGIQGPVGPQGPRGESGITAPVNGFFLLTVDEEGNLYAYSAEDGTTPEFEFDPETGNLYIVQEVEG